MTHSMPQRPRSHDLETESRRAFNSTIPSSWPTRSIEEDYGIDLEVEIFESGEATGLTFRVQLKATDKEPVDGSISRGDVKVTTLAYWRSLDAPVLVALYVANSRKFYTRWAHSYDPYQSTRPSARTVTFRFNAENLWSEHTVNQIRDDVKLIRALKRRDIGYPLPLHVELADHMHGHPEQEVRAHLRRAINASGGLLSLAQEAGPSARLSFQSSAIRAAMPADMATTTVHPSEGMYVGARGARTMVADAMVSIASLFVRVGLTHAAVDLVNTFALHSIIVRTGFVLEPLVEALLAEDYISEAFDLFSHLIDAPVAGEREVADLLLLMVQSHRRRDRLGPKQQQELMTRMLARASLTASEGLTIEASRAWYAVAGEYRALRTWDKSIEAFDAALAKDPTYRNRGYYWCERAGVLAYLHRYDEAANSYERAVECGDAPEAAFLLSDVLLRAGRYADALAVQMDDGLPEYYALGYRLHQRTLRYVLDTVGVDRQRRKEPPTRLLQTLSHSLDQVGILRALHDYDAADPRLWSLLAQARIGIDPDEFFATVLVAANFQLDDPTLWGLAALGAAISDASTSDQDDVCHSSMRWGETAFLEAVEDLCEAAPDDIAARLRAMVYARADTDLPRLPAITARIVDDDGNHEPFVIS